MNEKSIELWSHELYPDETVIVGLPLESKVDVEHIKKELGLPEYLDHTYYPIEKSIVTLYTIKNASKIWEKPKNPLTIKLFGGGAVKYYCPSANAEGGILNRELHDLDFVIPKNDYRSVKEILPQISEYAGSRYLYYYTPFDKRFNGLRGGRRIMVHGIHQIDDGGFPSAGVVDILVDRVEMRHTISLQEDLRQNNSTMHVIELHNLLLTKMQMIFDIKYSELVQNEHYRVLNDIYEHYSSQRVLMGMEKKDMLDICAILYDNDFGAGPQQINIDIIKNILKRDKKLCLTIRINTKNLIRNLHILLGSNHLKMEKAIREKASRFLDFIPDYNSTWKGPWWNTSVDIPKTL